VASPGRLNEDTTTDDDEGRNSDAETVTMHTDGRLNQHMAPTENRLDGEIVGSNVDQDVICIQASRDEEPDKKPKLEETRPKQNDGMRKDS